MHAANKFRCYNAQAKAKYIPSKRNFDLIDIRDNKSKDNTILFLAQKELTKLYHGQQQPLIKGKTLNNFIFKKQYFERILLINVL